MRALKVLGYVALGLTAFAGALALGAFLLGLFYGLATGRPLTLPTTDDDQKPQTTRSKEHHERNERPTDGRRAG